MEEAVTVSLLFALKNIYLMIKLTYANNHIKLVDEAYILNNNLNRWRGWSCSLGQYYLEINSAGGVKWGNCAQSIPIGNILDDNFSIKPLSNLVTCYQDECTCFADISIYKYSNNSQDSIKCVEPVNKKFDFNIYFIIDTKCNFNCFYCPPKLHSKSFTKPFNEIIQIKDKIFDLIKDYKVLLNFSGGEPTLFNELPIWIQEFKSLNIDNEALVTTNGSRSLSFLKKLSNDTNLNFSIHLHQNRLDALAQKINSVSYFSKNRVNVQIIYPPNYQRQLKIFLSHLNYNSINTQIQKVVNLDMKTVLHYSDSENKFINTFNSTKR